MESGYAPSHFRDIFFTLRKKKNITSLKYKGLPRENLKAPQNRQQVLFLRNRRTF